MDSVERGLTERELHGFELENITMVVYCGIRTQQPMTAFPPHGRFSKYQISEPLISSFRNHTKF